MKTEVSTPQLVFLQPQRLIVPLFQRPYVWNQENQWEPFWNDVALIANRLLQGSADTHQSHFLGAVVVQQVQNPVGAMQERTIIDGQQRLTTLQLLLDALHAELQAANALMPAKRIEQLVVNPEEYGESPEDRFKVWPTNRDRPAFNAVMSAEPPVDYAAVGHSNTRMVQAHRFFSEQTRDWLNQEGAEAVKERAEAIDKTVRDLLQIVMIDLAADENAQEIFETLNARGAQLTAADLIKNFIFQRLSQAGTNVEEAYEQHWKAFETGFWEREVSVGRVNHQRSSIFLNHWLIAKTGELIVAREIFKRFKQFCDHDTEQPMQALLPRVAKAASVYRKFIEAGETTTGPTDRVGLFVYRTGTMGSEAIKPLLLYLLDPEAPDIPEASLVKALDVVESWMVRRMLVRATTKSHTQVVSELISLLKSSDRQMAGEILEQYFVEQSGVNGYWPDDREVVTYLGTLLAYRRLNRRRLRMVLEAIEDHLRGWRSQQEGLGGERVARSEYAIEHVMPRTWRAHWPLEGPATAEEERDALIHTLGNLTLLTGKLNSKVSNGPWSGAGGKHEALQGHDVLLINRDLLETAEDSWTDDAINRRTHRLAKLIIGVWPVPDGHRSTHASEKTKIRKSVDLSDLISAGVLDPGIPLFARGKKFSDHVITLLSDGRIEVGGVAYESPSSAATMMRGSRTNGWGFFLLDRTSRPVRSLRKVRIDYIDAMAVDVEDDEAEDDEDEVE